MSKNAIPPNNDEMTLVQHLLELRNAMTKSVLAILIIFIMLFPFANEIYLYVSEPLSRFMPEGTSMIATGVASPFLTPFKLSLVLAIYISMPFLLYQLWTFIAPALYKHEKELVAPILFFSSFLFYAGGAFAFYVVFPLVFGFLAASVPEGITIATDIALYLDFVIKMFFAFGFAFEVPVIVVILILTGMVSPKKLAHARPYVVVGAFVIGMLLTPPDIISQTLLAVPIWILYEIGIIVGAFIKKHRKTPEQREALAEKQAQAKEHAQTNKKTTTKTATKATAEPKFQGIPEEEMDQRYAMQNEEDVDYDEMFDEIESEFKTLDQNHADQKNKKEQKKNKKLPKVSKKQQKKDKKKTKKE